METLLLILDLSGTFVFALSGAMAGVKHRLDLFGVLVLSSAAGNAGGIARDLLIGAVPPAAISDWRYLAVSILAGIVTFWWPSVIARLRSPVLIFDAAGLALFAVAGAQKALAFGLNPVMAALLGMLTGIGGGMTRDVLLAEIPTVLRADLYAVAALAGAAVVVIGAALQLPSTAVTIAGAVLCFGLRFIAIRRGWHLPVAAEPEPPTTKAHGRPGDRSLRAHRAHGEPWLYRYPCLPHPLRLLPRSTAGWSARSERRVLPIPVAEDRLIRIEGR